MAPFNLPGVVFFLVSASLSWAGIELFGDDRPWSGFVFAGPTMALADGYYRRTWGERQWFWPWAGGHVCYLPCWVLGAAWCAAAAYHLAAGR